MIASRVDPRRHLRRPVLRRMSKLGTRAARELASGRRARALQRANLASRESVRGTAPVVVSLTTFGSRVGKVFLTIESIAAGTTRPRRMILWLDDEDRYLQRPDSLRRLEDRGLEVMLTDRIGPHAKYFPTLPLAEQDALALVTADDDIVYPRRWLGDLVAGAAATPSTIVCHQSHRVSFAPDGALLPYVRWAENWRDDASGRVFALGVSGVLYPSPMIDALLHRGEGFRQCSPRADDVWLHYVAASSRIQVRQVTGTPTHFVWVGADGPRLSTTNIGSTGNDDQIAATYDEATLEWIRSQP